MVGQAMTYRNFTEAERKAIGFIGNRCITAAKLTERTGMDGMAIFKSLKDKGVIRYRGMGAFVKEPWRIFNPDGTRNGR